MATTVGSLNIGLPSLTAQTIAGHLAAEDGSSVGDLDGSEVRVTLATNSGFTAGVINSEWTAISTNAAGLARSPAPGAHDLAAFRLTCPTLTAGQRYYFRIEHRQLPGNTGTTLAPRVGALSAVPSFVARNMATVRTLTYVFTSCTDHVTRDRAAYADVNGDHPVHTAIKDLTPDGHVDLGDLFYTDVGGSAAGAQLKAGWEKIGMQPYRNEMMWNVPWVYFWDDHDFGPNNSWSGSAAGPASAATYRECVAHQTLTDSLGIWQTWVDSRVRFVGYDSRAYRDKNTDSDGPSKTMLGATQKAWWKAQVEAFQDAADEWLLVLCFPTPVIANKQLPDSWGVFQWERAELFNWLAGNDPSFGGVQLPKRVIIMQGDKHASRLDDGTHVDYSDGGLWLVEGQPSSLPDAGRLELDPTKNALQSPIVLAQACSTNPPNFSLQGGPFSHDPGVATAGCFTKLTVVENVDGTMGVTVENLIADGTTGNLSAVQGGLGDMTETFTINADTPTVPPPDPGPAGDNTIQIDLGAGLVDCDGPYIDLGAGLVRAEAGPPAV